MVSENKEKKPRILIGIIIIIFIVIIIVIFVMGVRGIFKIISTIAIILLVLSVLFMLAYLFWWVFIKKQRFDPVYVNKQKLILAGKINHQKGLLNDLFISGDKTHSRVRIGKIIGYCRIQVLSRLNRFDKEGNILYKINPDTKIKEPDYDLKAEEQDVFIVKKTAFQGVFSDPFVIRVSPNDHDQLIGDVTLMGFSLIPISEYFFLNSDYLDVRKIDFAILKESQRGVMFEHLRDMKTIVDSAIGLDSSHKKFIEKKDLVEVPEQQRIT